MRWAVRWSGAEEVAERVRLVVCVVVFVVVLLGVGRNGWLREVVIEGVVVRARWSGGSRGRRMRMLIS